MAYFLYNLLLMSISGTIMFLLASALNRQTKNKYARWYYALLITSVLLFILPMQQLIPVPRAVTVELPRNMQLYADGGVIPQKSAGLDVSYIIFALWAVGTSALLGFNAYSYVRTRRTLKDVSEITLDVRSLMACKKARERLGVRRSIEVRKSTVLRSPLLFGVIKPVIILPQTRFTDDELEMIFTHEVTHFKHRDLIVKLAAIFASSLHWFNPCVYIMKNAVNNSCELCCDETVLSVLNIADKKSYGRLLLSVIEGGKGGFAYTTAMSSSQSLKQRLLKIVEFKRMSLPLKMVSVMLALSMTVCSVTAFGFEMAKDTLPDSISRAIDNTKPKKDKVDASAAYFDNDADEEIPQSTPSPAPAPNASGAPTSENEQSENASGEPSYFYETAENYTETESEAEYEPNYGGAYDDSADVPVYVPAPKEESERAAAPSGKADAGETQVRFPDTNYMFSPAFSKTGSDRIQSSLIYVTRDCYMRVSCFDDCDFGLYRADGSLLLTKEQLKNVKVPVKTGEGYYVIAQSESCADTNIFIYAD